MIKFKCAVFIPLLCVTIVAASGCALLLIGTGAAIGVGTVAYVKGELKTAENVSLDRAWNASLKTVKELDFKVTDTDKDALNGAIIARGADDRKITVKLKKQSDQVTEFRIRVGIIGDETLSRLIFDKIKKNF